MAWTFCVETGKVHRKRGNLARLDDGSAVFVPCGRDRHYEVIVGESITEQPLGDSS